LVYLLAVLLAITCIFDVVDGKAKKKKKIDGGKMSTRDLAKYLGCQGCLAMTTTIFHQAKKIVDEGGGRKKTGEEPILEMLEEICDPDTELGEWLTKVDVTGETGVLVLDIMNEYSECKGTECKALTKVCEDVKTQIGDAEIAEKVYRGHYMTSPEAFSQAMCGKVSKFCPSKPLPGKRVDEPFDGTDQEAIKAKRMQKNLKAMGMGTQMYDRESMEEELHNMEEKMADMGYGDEVRGMREAMEKETAGEDGDMGRLGGDGGPKSVVETAKEAVSSFGEIAVDASRRVTEAIDQTIASVSKTLGFGGTSESKQDL